MEGNSYVLEMKNISMQFPGVKALDNVDFSVARGEIHALVGENGAGKSTLIKILGGVYLPTSGEILVEGKKVTYSSPQEAAAAGISIVHQELNLVPYMCVAENLFMGRSLPKNKWGMVNWSELYRKAAELLTVVGLQDLVRYPAGRLSVAQQQLLQIGRAVSFGAKIVVFDEPTACLSRSEVENLFRVIRSLKERGTSIIYVSHRLEEIFELADRVTVLRDGKRVGVHEINQVSPQQIISLMLGKELSKERRRQSYVQDEVVLRAEGLCSDTGVRDVSFELRKGEVVGLAGVVGSGRTEVARLLFGVDKLTSGRIFVGEEQIFPPNIRKAIRAGLAFVPEDRRNQGLVLNMTVKENASLAFLKNFARYGFISHAKEKERVQGLIRTLSIRPPEASRIVKYLSGGNQQKVVLAKWLAGAKPKVVIFDEPTQGIDVGAKAEVHQLIDNLAREGAGILLISSDIQELLSLCDRILVMVRGKIVKCLSREEATASTILAYAMRKENSAEYA
ncbi:ribose transport system ATP-binding protein [Thermanaeromonas toyohensis ToBE]|uniref:Ribose transport system ATP-binding protein n=1 Tax=Thermanaeromonas toyohensis ToBE TaxID=698762 RepID=A0A1W1VPE6_9FIRM|nr:sugar ABC transporter ATP-binding protein [Thermanaeromonas toyohensis]SMB95196.1 ribose transport system ATP-binding protein [Thermanaeromonas toyohensis ToBE]